MHQLKQTNAFIIVFFTLICFQSRSQTSFENNYQLPYYNLLWEESSIVTHPFDSGFFYTQGINIGNDQSSMIIYFDDTGKVNFGKRFIHALNPLSFAGIEINNLPDTTLMLNMYMGVNSAFVKTDLAGNLLHASQISNPATTTVYKSTSLGNYLYGVGRCYFNSKNCAFFAKFDLNGNALWARAFETTNDIQNYLYDIIQTSDGGFFMVGSRGLYGGPLVEEAILFKTDSLGNIIWQIQHGKLGVNLGARGCLQTTDGGYLIQTTEGGNLPSGFLKVDSIGNTMWNRKYFMLPNEQPILESLNMITSNKFVAGGMISYGAVPRPFTMTIDSIGNVIEAKKYGGYNNYMTTTTAHFDSNKGMAITGYEYSNNPATLFFMNTDINLNAQCLYQNVVISDSSYAITDSVINYGSVIIPSFATLDITADILTDTLSLIGNDYCASQPVIIPVVNLASSDSVLCEKDYIDFFDLSINNPTSWQWYFPNAAPATSTLQNPSNIFYNTYGIYDIALVACNSAGCDSIFLPGYIQVFPIPAVPVITQNYDTLFSSSAFSYAWYESSNASQILSTDSFLVTTQNGNYYVIITDSNGCGVTSNLVVINTGIAQFTDMDGQGVSYYPNPANDVIHLNFNNFDVHANLQISNLLGEAVLQVSLHHRHSMLDISALTDGIYFLKIVNEGNLFICKVVVQ